MTSHPEPGDEERWWRDAVIYQVYVRSFADSDGDGTGDINGIRSRLPYLAELGVDGLWVNPWYVSPLHDGGYDVADYRDIHPAYGTLNDARSMISEAHENGLKVIVDLVPNHTSTDHVWFQEALSAPPGHPSRDRYHIRDGRNDGLEPPTNWVSVFGGPAWKRLPDGQWFMHIFDETQADLNWTNPEVQAEFLSIFQYWLDIGADGFRVDVAHGLAKDMEFTDTPAESEEILVVSKLDDHPFWDRDEVHTYIRQWRAVLDAHTPIDGASRAMMVAEAWVDPSRAHLYLRPDEYQQSFAFDFLEAQWDAEELTTNIKKALAAAARVDAFPTWTLSNHDVVRHATRYGLPNGTEWRKWLLEGPHDDLDPELGERRARAAALFMLALPGSAYLYQGEELGLPEVWDLPFEVLDDPVWEQSGHTNKGRDGCRVPIPWEPTGPSLGFGSGDPWLPQPETFAKLSAAAQMGQPGSMLELYRATLKARREHLETEAPIAWSDGVPANLVAFNRGDNFWCWINFGTKSIPLPQTATILVASDPDTEIGREVLPDSAVWFRED